MTEIKNRQALIEVEYCLDKYFEENFSPIVAKASKEMKEKQQIEAQKIRSGASGSPWGVTGSAGLPVQSMVIEQQVHQGEWNSKRTEDLIEMCNEKFFKNENIQHDYQVLVLSYRSALVGSIGEQRYLELSKQSESGDLATDYVYSRFQQKLMEQLAKQGMPQSSLEYILSKGVGSSLAGMIATAGITARETEKDAELKALSTKLYAPSATEKLSAGAVSFVTDFAATGGMGTAGWLGKTLLGLDALSQLSLPFVEDIEEDSYEKALSQELFGDSTVLGELQSQAKSVKVQRSENIARVNSCLNQQMKLPAYQAPLNQAELKKMTSRLEKTALSDVENFFSNIQSIYAKMEIPYKLKSQYPDWMEGKSQESLLHSASFFTSLALQMKERGMKTTYVGKTKMSFQQVAQKGYDYALAAYSQAPLRRDEETQEATGHSTQLHQTMYVQSQHTANFPDQSVNLNMVQPSFAHPTTTTQVGLDSWGGLLNGLGLQGFGDVGKNLGYVMAMLPDMLVGLFSGKNKSFTLNNSLLPLAAIFAGMFIRNPLLKMMLIGLGGASLLNKAGQEALGAVRGQSFQKSTHLSYQRYEEEPLSERITDPVLKGNTLVANIDKVPCVITIESDSVLDAYNKGAIPLSTLANAVVRKYDDQCALLAQNYARQSQIDQHQERSLGIK